MCIGQFFARVLLCSGSLGCLMEGGEEKVMSASTHEGKVKDLEASVAAEVAGAF